MIRRFFLSGLIAALFTACSTPQLAATNSPSAATVATLAPTGTLRVGVYPGSPTSLVVDSAGRRSGVAYEMGQALGKRLGVPVQIVEHRRVAEVIDGLRNGQVDFTITNASAARAQLVSFSKPLISLELGYLVRPGSTIRSPSDIDRPGIRVGVTEGSSSQVALASRFQHATVVPAASLKLVAEGLQKGELDVFATNKAILYELADSVAGASILEGRWGLEHMAMAIPKGREAALVELDAFAETVRADGQMAAVVRRAGLRGTVEP